MIYLFVFLLSGCVSQSAQKLNPAVYYKNDICFEHKETKTEFCGVGVLPESPIQNIKIKSFGKLNFFAMTTCHKEFTTENPDKGIFKKNGIYEIEYVQTEIERQKGCPIFVSAYNKSQKHAWGVIAFQSKRFKLEAEIQCNGDKNRTDGVSICQTREGLIQKISFSEPVDMARPAKGSVDRKEDCPRLETEDDKEFEFAMPNRECIYQFRGKESKKVHRLFTVGYEEIIVRE